MKMNDYLRRWDKKSKRWIYEHREIMENFLGRKLNKDEHIHHKDGNPKNNNFDNLELTDARNHIKFHCPKANYGVTICMIDGCNNLQHAKKLCKKHYAQKFRKQQKW